MTDDVWAIVHAERAALIDDLAHLEDDQWLKPSLCDGWTVHDVLAHLVDTARTTRLGFVKDLALARFDFNRQNTRGVERERRSTPQETLERFRQVASRTSTLRRPSTAGSSKKSSTARTSAGPSASPAPTPRRPLSDHSACRHAPRRPSAAPRNY
ncbi:maleylpyruvate isomerase family mycothiol-dependent enzyme [Streptomyces sp. NPDC055144]